MPRVEQIFDDRERSVCERGGSSIKGSIMRHFQQVLMIPGGLGLEKKRRHDLSIEGYASELEGGIRPVV